MKKTYLIILFAVLFLSCANQSTDIKDIAKQWTEIDRLFTTNTADRDLIKATDIFCLSLVEFQKSGLYRTYSAIPFSQQSKRGGTFYLPAVNDIEEVVIMSDMAIEFRDSIVNTDTEKAKIISAQISNIIIRLLIIDANAQKYIGSSYFRLLVTLIVFIIIIAFFMWFLHRSLTSSLKREAEGKVFSHAHIFAQEEERLRISRELHDTIIQDMRYVLLETEKIGSTDEKNEREKLVEKTVHKITDLIRKTRDICNNLVPPDFRNSELPNALRHLCHDFNEKTGIDCRAEIDENINLDFLSMEKKLQVFRIIQEALVNIEKHAGAKEAIVTMRAGKDGTVYIGISDDGIGFISPLDSKGRIITAIDKSRIGIISMKERSCLLGGFLTIITEPGEGTLVCLEIPGNCPKKIITTEVTE